MLAGGKGAKSFVDRCVSFVGENAAKCVKTNTFLNLPKESLIKLISSDCVCMIMLKTTKYKCFTSIVMRNISTGEPVIEMRFTKEDWRN